MLDDNQKAVSDAENTIRQIKSEADKESRRIKLLDTRLKDVEDWAMRFDFMSFDEQRAVLNQLIERIEVTIKSLVS